ncbi:MAG: hypothetical protein K8R92_12325 [Planctomycetes bacterium]|nr:hypothetical protein [Planctomycetota bacterium]
MPIRTTIQPFVFWRNAIFAFLCLVFGVWGYYDWAVKIPNLEADCIAIDSAKEEIKKFETMAATAPLNQSDTARYVAAKKTVEEINSRNAGPPVKPSPLDRPMQMWLYVVGCGILGTPFFIWPIVKILRRQYRLDEDGTLHTPGGTYTRDQIVEIDMRRWCAKDGDRRSTWTATAVTDEGKRIVLDDHDFKNMHLIIGGIAHRLMPAKWTVEAKPVAASPNDAGAPANSEVAAN